MTFSSTDDNQNKRKTADADIEKQDIVAEPQDEEKAGKSYEVLVSREQAARLMKTLEGLESKLGAFLGTHIDEIKALQTNAVQHANAQKRKPPITTGVSDAGNSEDESVTVLHGQAASSQIHTHVKHLDEFLNNYMGNVRALQERLNEKFPDGQERTAENVDIEAKMYESMLQQFNMQLLVSTFTSGLIVAFCGLAGGLRIAGTYAERLYNVGLLLSLLAVTFHFFNILISGRCVALCSGHTLVKERTMAYFYRTLATCEQLYLHGTLVFGVAVLEMSFIMFDHWVYPVVFCCAVAVGIVILATGKFRKMSILYQNVVRIKALVWTFGGRVAGKRQGNGQQHGII